MSTGGAFGPRVVCISRGLSSFEGNHVEHFLWPRKVPIFFSFKVAQIQKQLEALKDTWIRFWDLGKWAKFWGYFGIRFFSFKMSTHRWFFRWGLGWTHVLGVVRGPYLGTGRIPGKPIRIPGILSHINHSLAVGIKTVNHEGSCLIQPLFEFRGIPHQPLLPTGPLGWFFQRLLMQKASRPRPALPGSRRGQDSSMSKTS